MYRILQIEDDAMDVKLLHEALQHVPLPIEVRVAAHGQEAMKLLEAAREDASAWRPDLILCDLQMPVLDGHGFLRALKQNRGLCPVPVIMMTASTRGFELCYQLHANCCLQKPATFDELCLVMRRLTEFWLETVRLPEQAAS